MIQIADKYKCCGCGACIQACPKQCISFHTDEEGFAYPAVDADKCIDCGLCEKVCPCLHQTESNNPVHVYAAKNPDESIRMQSSSGGIFSLLAEQTIQEGGVVFGARFNDQWEVIHDYTTTIEGLAAFRGSKYVQSRIGNTYQEAQQFLKEGRKVLFSGTPCQIAGLKLYLRKDYDNLLTIECVCHGVPGPGLWRQYLCEQTKRDGCTITNIQTINFRDKYSGWANYSFTIFYKDCKTTRHLHDNNPWERAFIKNIDLRPSCHSCPAKYNNSSADITLGDLWGAGQLLSEQNDSKGVTLVLLHNNKALNCLSDLKGLKEFDVDEVAQYNPAMIHSSPAHPAREEFFRKVYKKGFVKTVKSMTQDSFLVRMKMAIAKLIRR